MRVRFTATLICCLVATAMGLGATAAHAAGGDYTVMVCSNPDTGAGMMPVDRALPAGWTLNTSNQKIGPSTSETLCGPGTTTPSRGVVISVWVPFTSTTPGDGTGALSFVPPAGTALKRAELFWAGSTGSTANHMAFSVHGGIWSHAFAAPLIASCEWSAPYSCSSLGNASSPWATQNRVVADPAPADGLSVTLACAIPDSSWTCHATDESVVRVFGGKLVLRDESNPQLSGELSGDLATQPVVRGDADLTVNATDAGAGVYRLRLLVDDVQALTRVVDGNGGKCADVNPANADPYEFADPVPCRTSTGGTYVFDTRALPEGAHNVKVVLEDAAGNASTLSNRDVVVDNVPDSAPGGGGGTPGGTSPGDTAPGGTSPGGGGNGLVPFDRGAPNGAGASEHAVLSARWATTARAVKRARFGLRHVVTGRLADEQGRPIRNARVELFTTARARGARAVGRGVATTREDGSWTLALARSATSGRMEFRYRSHVNDLVAAATATLQLRVAAGLRLAIAPRLAHRGTTIRLRGRLLGRPVPRQGKVLELQARTAGRGWVTFRTVRTSKSGVFKTRYRFRRGGPVTYYLRVRARSAGDYPFDTGSSKALGVRVR